MKNQSMMEDFRVSEGEDEDARKKVAQRKFQRKNLEWGLIAAPAGHVFSVVIETLGIESDFEKFIDELYGIREEMKSFLPPVRHYDPMRTFTAFDELSRYLLRKSISEEDYRTIMFAVIGWEDETFLMYYPYK